jgi:hypothetical protein
VARAIAVFACGSALALIAFDVLVYARVNDDLNEYMSAGPFIKPGSTLLSLELDGASVPHEMVHPLLHAAGYVAAQRSVVDFTNYEANEGYFPIGFIPAANPYTHIGDGEQHPFVLDILDYTKRTGRNLDYVLLWGGDDAETAARADVQPVLAQLRVGYEQIYVSPRRGLVRLYRRK